MNWLLLFVPATVGLELLAPERYLLIFMVSSLAILPLAWWMGQATEQLAERLGEAIGGLLNATFGNAAELIIALAALRAGLHDVVKASIAGSIIGNILLVLGAAMLAGGLRRPEQHFNPAGARSQATMLTLAAIAFVLPAAFGAAANATSESLSKLSVSISIVLLVAYLLNLTFALITHRVLFAGSYLPKAGKAHTSVVRAALTLAGATAGIVWMSEIMVRTIEPTVHELGLNDVFVGVFVVALMGNAAEHATAITAAWKDRMDLSLSIAIGSSVQIALLVAPIIVLASLILGPKPMDLAFPTGLVLTILLSVVITGQVAGDGRSDWLKGAQLLIVYFVLALTFFFLPSTSSSLPHN
jgi:Ca2+:H+ antiporter